MTDLIKKYSNTFAESSDITSNNRKPYWPSRILYDTALCLRSLQLIRKAYLQSHPARMDWQVIFLYQTGDELRRFHLL